MDSMWKTIEQMKKKIIADGDDDMTKFPLLEKEMDIALKTAKGGMFHGKLNPEGKPWEVESRGKTLVESSKGVKRKNKLFRCTFTVPDSCCRTVFDNIRMTDTRAQWDEEGILKGDTLTNFTNTGKEREVLLEIFTSKPQAGGIVSPRFFCDIRCTDIEFAPTGEIMSMHSTGRSVNSSVYSPLRAVEKSVSGTSLVKATNFCGGTVLKQVGEDVECIVYVQSEIGGWLPTSIINAAMAGSLQNSTDGVSKACRGSSIISRGSLISRSSVIEPNENEEKSTAPKSTHLTADAPRKQTPKITRETPPHSNMVRIRPPGCQDVKFYAWKMVAVEV